MTGIGVRKLYHLGSAPTALAGFVTIRDCLILFAFYNVGKVSFHWTGVRAVELNTEN